MKNVQRLLTRICCFTLLTASSSVLADVISLTDGTVLEGELIGRDNGIVMFRVDGSVRAFPEAEVAALVETDDAAPAAQEIQSNLYSVPAGTRLVLTMSETVDSRQHEVGHQFRATLESALVVEGVTVVPRGATVLGTVAEAEQARRLAGQSELEIRFTDIMINDQLVPIATGDLVVQGAPEGRRTVRRAARGAVLGGLIDGSDGARTGARVGAGAALLTRGASVNVSAGTILETELRVPLSLSQ